MEEPQPYHNSIAVGGKWMDHPSSSDLAQRFAHHIAEKKGNPDVVSAMSPGDYEVATVQTKVEYLKLCFRAMDVLV